MACRQGRAKRGAVLNIYSPWCPLWDYVYGTLVQFYPGCRTRLTVSVVLMTSHVFLVLEAAYSPAARAVVCSSAREERSVIPLTVMTPRGLGILSVR